MTDKIKERFEKRLKGYNNKSMILYFVEDAIEETKKDILEEIDKFENELRDNHVIMTEEMLEKLKEQLK